jgi:hypothetical protein
MLCIALVAFCGIAPVWLPELNRRYGMKGFSTVAIITASLLAVLLFDML